MSAVQRTESDQSDSTNGNACRFAVEVARIAADKQTNNVVVLDLRGLSKLTDFFVIGTGTSNRQMHAVADTIKQHARSLERRPLHIADKREATWLLADYIDVVVHLFDARHREYYDLDSLWGDAPQVDWQAETAEASRPEG